MQQDCEALTCSDEYVNAVQVRSSHLTIGRITCCIDHHKGYALGQIQKLLGWWSSTPDGVQGHNPWWDSAAKWHSCDIHLHLYQFISLFNI